MLVWVYCGRTSVTCSLIIWPFLSKQFIGSKDSHILLQPSISGTAFLFQTEALSPLDTALFPQLPAPPWCAFPLWPWLQVTRVSGVAAAVRRWQPVPRVSHISLLPSCGWTVFHGASTPHHGRPPPLMDTWPCSLTVWRP